MEHQQALQMAQELVERISPFCRRVEIAGSIRRGKPEVKDMEIVAIPLWEELPDPTDLFGERTMRANRLHKWANSSDCLVEWIKPGTRGIVPWRVEPTGRYWRGLLGGNLKLDLFLCEPDNWGAIYLIRTGSAEFSYAVATRAKKLGMGFVNGSLTREGQPVSTPEERDIFDLLRLKWVEPQNRTGFEMIQPLPRRSDQDRFTWTEDNIEIIKAGRP